MNLIDLAPEQRRHLEDVREFWSAWEPWSRQREGLSGAMSWKTVKGRQYLVRYWNDEDTGEKRMRSLGPRTGTTEAQKADFEFERAQADAALAPLRERASGLSRVGKALKMGRLDNTSAEVLRQVWRADLGLSRFAVCGSSAVHLYEASAGVFLPNAILPACDLDLLVGGEVDRDEIEAILRRADKSFRRVRGGPQQMINSDGFRVDLIDRREMLWRVDGLKDLSPHQRRALGDVLELPTVRAIAVARDGFPVPMTGLDPRSFALLKFAMSESDPKRSNNAAAIDREQAFAVGALVEAHWRESFEPEWLEAFPEFADRIGRSAPKPGGAAFFL